MTVNLDTAKTGIFARLGKVFGIVKRTEQFQSDIIDNASQSFQEALNEYVNTLGATANTDLDFADSLISNLDEVRNQAGTHIIQRCRAAALKTLIEMVDADTKIPLRSTTRALVELREQMKTASETVDGTSITIGSTSAAGTGTGTVVVSAEADNRHHEGIVSYPTIRTETLEFQCVTDSTSARATRGGEIFSIRGKQAFPQTDHRWPGGTGNWGNYAATSDLGSDGQSAGVNVLRNSSFNSFDDANGPVSWNLAVGSAGVHVFEDTTNNARGVSGLELRNDGSTKIRLMQQIDSKEPNSTRGKIPVDRLCCISFLVKRSNTSPSAGQLSVGLYQSDGTVVTGTTVSLAHGAIATSYAVKTVAFRVPLSLPNPLYFGIECSTAFTSGCYLHIDGLVCATMYRNGPSSPGCLIVPGTTDFIVGDKMTVAITNNGEGEIERYMDRIFGTYALGIYVPNNILGGETVADSLVS